MLTELKLLGKVLLRQGDETISLSQRRTLLLVTYLLCHDTWQPREDIQLLFWPDDDARQGGNKLRQLIHRTKQESYAEPIEVREDAVRLELPNDIHQFRTAFANNQWQDALKLYRGELLDGMQAKGLDSYQEWLDAERSDLKQLWREASLQFSVVLGNSGQHAEAAQFLKAVLDTDYLDEDVLQAYLQHLSYSEQRSLAVKSYQEFKTQLWDELQLEPLEETQQLFESIKALPEKPKSIEIQKTELTEPEVPIQPEALEVQAATLTSSTPTIVEAKSTLLGITPSFNTPFVGRDIELAELTSGLQDDNCRLQTLLGFGGVGKTRLAVEIFQQADKHFVDGAVFVALSGISSDKESTKEKLVPLVASAILQALSIEQTAQQSTDALLQRLFTTLRHQQMLIVLDNFEHVMPATELIIELLEAAPQVKVLVTSREALGLYNEHLFDISGLASPPLDDVENIEIYDAVQLFIRSARRVKADFVITENSKVAVAEICNLLQGSPLALELAAAWVRLMPPREIVEELSRNLDILESNYPDLPQRHRSLEAIFEHSWELLSLEEQKTLQRLAIFEGGFSKDAAVNVTGASLRSMFSLVNKSLLKRDETGRFSKHLVVEQYSKQRLLGDETLYQELAGKHAEYYRQWTIECIEKNPQSTWIEEISENYSNIESALKWAESSGNSEQLLRVTRAVTQFWTIRGHYVDLDNENWLEKSLRLVSPDIDSKSYCKVLNCLGFMLIHKDPDKARELFLQAVGIAENHGLFDNSAEAYTLLMFISNHRAKREEAYGYVEKALDAAHKAEADPARAVSHARLNRGLIYIQDAKYDLAKLDFEHCLNYYKSIGDDFGRANSLINLGLIAIYKEQYEDAKQYYIDSLALNKDINNKSGIAMSYNNLGFVTGRLQQYDEAIDYLLLGLETCEEQYFNNLKIATHNSVGMVATLKEDFELAKNHYQTALKLSLLSDNFYNQAEALEGLGTIETNTKQFESAAQLFNIATSIRKEKSLVLPDSEKEIIEASFGIVKKALGNEALNSSFQFDDVKSYLDEYLNTKTFV